MKLLRIDSSARHNSVSRRLTGAFVTAWRSANPAGEVTERDLAATTLPVITTEWTQAAFTDSAKRSEEQWQVLLPSETFITELEAAGIIVISVPMYNFTISAPLKGWIDHIVRPGRTVAYGPDGPKGLLAGKKTFVLTSRGGMYATGLPAGARDYQEPYLRLISPTSVSQTSPSSMRKTSCVPNQLKSPGTRQ
jgi:FMN-dependent NADH-azoreductase